MTIDRRSALGLLGLGAGTAACAPTTGAAPGDQNTLDEGGGVVFEHGVASGDPFETSVLLWTRISTDSPRLSVQWQVASDEGFQRIVSQGRTETSAARDHTVKVVADRLIPGNDYFYRFIAGAAQTSPVGRTRTAPEKTSGETVVLAVASCSLHPNGLFNAYDAIAKMQTVHAVVHLGDYLYEYGAGENDYGMANGRRLSRIPQPPHEILSLSDYRLRHAQYKADPDLQAAHARAPWIVVYDDHETANDSYDGGAENHEADEGDWAERKAVALKAYFEWMPIRDPQPGQGLAQATERSFRFGRSASLHMVETRLLARTRQLDYATDFYSAGPDGQPVPDRDGFFARLNDASRRLLGDEQLGWIERDTKAAVDEGVAWQLIGNQVVMARVKGPDIGAMVSPEQLEASLADLPEALQARVRQIVALFGQDVPFNLDAWDGYPAERERLYAALNRSGARPVVLAGDSHTFWVDQLKDGSGRKAGIEFGTTGITSPSPAGFLGLPEDQLAQVIMAQSEEVDYVDFGPRGFIALTLTPQTVRAELIGVSTITAKPYQTKVVRRYEATAGERGVIGDLRAV